jgi:hypothetical protein
MQYRKDKYSRKKDRRREWQVGGQKAGRRKILGGKKLNKNKVWRKRRKGRQNGMKALKRKDCYFFNVEGKVDRLKQTNGTKHIQNSPRNDTQETKRR